jgi:flagellar basal-body rod protein FlgC
MFSAASIAASGLQFQSDRLYVVAANTANALTPGYKAGILTGVAQEQGGVRGAFSRDLSSGPSAMDAQGLLQELSNVDLETQAVTMISALRAYEANAAVIRTTDELLGTVLNRRA